jgi:hypothetical protein
MWHLKKTNEVFPDVRIVSLSLMKIDKKKKVNILAPKKLMINFETFAKMTLELS